MKRLLIPILLISFVAGVSCSLNAQTDKKKEKKVKIKIEKETNEGKTRIDTTFTLKDDEELDKILEKYGVKANIIEKHANDFDIDIETDDSIGSANKNKMVWVSVDVDDSNSHKTKIKNKNKQVIFISDDDDSQIQTSGNVRVFQTGGDDEEVIIEELDGDSVKITKKIIITEGKSPKHKKIKRVYKFNTDSLGDDEQMIFITDDDEHRVIINDKDIDNDSVKVFAKKIKKGKHGKRIYITTDDDFNWNTDEDIHVESKDKKMNRVKVEILDPTNEDFKTLKLKENYKTLNINDFMIFIDNKKDKMNIQFTSPEKENLSVKIFDQTGKAVFSDDKKQFEGKYKNETEAIKGTFLIQINQGKKYFVRKMILDWNK